MRILDSHVHFWQIDRPGHRWPGEDWPRLYRNFLPDDLRRETTALDFAGAILVQSQPDDRDTDWLCELDDPLVRAVVGWVDLTDSGAPCRIVELAGHPKLKGLRPMLQGIVDTEWILRPAVSAAIEAMLDHGLRFDALVEPRHLPTLDTFATRWPDLQIVIDHAAKPHASHNELDPWRDQIAALAERPNLWCKLSGLRTEQAVGQAIGDLRPYVAHLVDSFGERLMWGSDWPVICHVGDSYVDWVVATLDLIGDSGRSDQDRLFHDAAASFYTIDV
ncbi:amidohydrolase family protein [Sphingomonas faeni]|uniref:amidohydrolase family protein n=1 Tax=Sphingomonas faeni TaxID=185950 RepID=UPI00278846AE|nr:amidohydrolase family protein [Sphingomonas faeni]MDQ0839911.1 L-fuconolactonase [Sphingomonas faeni]